MAKNPESVPELLQSWDRRALKAVDAHYESGRFYARFNLYIGIPTVVLGAAIAALAFATVGRQSPFWMQLGIGLLALVQTVLAALHTWLRHSETAEKHRHAGARYAAVRRHIEQLRVLGPSPASDILTSIRQELDSLAREAPYIPAQIWHRTQSAFKGHGTADGKVLNPAAPADT